MLAKPCWETPEFLGCLGGDGGGSRPRAPRGRHAESLEESLSSRVPLSPRLGCLPGSVFMFSLQIDCPRSSLRVCSSRTEHARAPDPGPPCRPTSRALVVISGPPETLPPEPTGVLVRNQPPAPGPLLRAVQEVCEMSRSLG